MWFKNLFKKRKHYDIVDLEKVKSNYGPPQFTLYDPSTARVIDLDDVQSFVIYERDKEKMKMIAEEGFIIEHLYSLDSNWWICNRDKDVRIFSFENCYTFECDGQN